MLFLGNPEIINLRSLQPNDDLPKLSLLYRQYLFTYERKDKQVRLTIWLLQSLFHDKIHH